MCKGISFGFGTGHICAALVASVMVLGLYFPIENVARFRIEFLDRFCEGCGSLLCPDLRAKGDCREIVAFAAKTLDDILSANKQYSDMALRQ